MLIDKTPPAAAITGSFSTAAKQPFLFLN